MTADRPYATLVKGLGTLPGHAALEYYLEIAPELSVESESKEGGPFILLARELAAQEDVTVLEKLERGIKDSTRKAILWGELSSWTEHELCRAPDSARGLKARGLLEKWSTEYADSVLLSAYHPRGVELLLDKVEDTTMLTKERARAASMIGRIGKPDVIPRLREFADDPTPVVFSCPSTSDEETLGSIIREVIRQLEAK
jgi:hypothetical protein